MPTPDAPRYHLDGCAVTDEPSFYAELGAAVRAPDGYYGSNLDALADCLRGGFGPQPPFTLVWHASALAAERLDRKVLIEGREGSYFEAVLDVLRRGGVAVRLR
ncbi:barstar family protein [Kitasatospora sp. NPDC059571]|uniref:barstar family protein n=1 Tax=Kitasatospora sp. NPDC059571 TaxID=3346871 RepID=UPI0036A11407